MSEEQSMNEEVESVDKVNKLEEEIDRLKANVQSSSDEIKQTVEDLSLIHI